MIDLKQVIVRFAIHSVVGVDMERVEADPVWQMVAGQFDDTPGGRAAALVEYLTRYISAEVLLANTPFTNGPADLVGIEVDVVQKEDFESHG